MRDSIRQRLYRAHALATATPRERLVLRTVRALRETTRAGLIQETGLSGTAVFRATNDLAERGLIEIGAPVVSGRGQPSNAIRLRTDALAALGVSVMTDHAEAVLMDFSGTVRASASVGVPGMERDAVAARIARFLDRTLRQLDLPRAAVIGGGLAIAGYFVPGRNAVNPAAELDDWALTDLAAALEASLDLPFEVENIANAAAVGEHLLGVGRWSGSFAYLNFAHGFGAGLIAGGAPLRGACGNAGEVAGLLDLAGLPSPSLGSLRQHLASCGVATEGIVDLAQRFRPDWPGVEDWIAAHGPSVSFVANALRYVLDLDAVVLGGLIPASLADRLIGEVRWLDESRPPRRGFGWQTPRLVRAEVVDRAAATGVAALLLSRDYFDEPGAGNGSNVSP
jgi:predicted NBD/HSP70 family sugar kinase